MLNERKLTERELESREVVLQSLLKNKRNLVKRYGKDAEKVMYGIATKKAKTKVEGMNKEKIKELIQQTLYKEDATPKNEDNWADYQDIGQFYLEGFGKEHTLTNSQLEELGKKIVKQLYKGDVGKAYDDLVNRFKNPKDIKKEDNDPSGADLEGDPSEFVVGERVSFDDILDLRSDKKDLEDRIAQVYRDMEQEAEPEGGEVSDRYGSELDKLEGKLYKVMSKINDYDMNESTVTESKGAKNYFDDLKYYYQKAFRYLEADEKEEYKQLAKDYFSKLQEIKEDEYRGVEFEDYIDELEKTMYVDRRDRGRFIIHPLDKPDVRRPSRDYIVIDGNNVTAVQGYNTGPISDLADRYGLDDEDDRMTDMGKTNASGRVSLLSSNILKDAIKAIKASRDAEAKAQSDYYKDRGPVSGIGNMDEEVTSPEEEKLKQISKELKGASKMHAGQAKKIAKIVKEKLTKGSSVEDHVDDFKDSDAPQFKGKSKDKKVQMAVAAYLSKKNK